MQVKCTKREKAQQPYYSRRNERSAYECTCVCATDGYARSCYHTSRTMTKHERSEIIKLFQTPPSFASGFFFLALKWTDVGAKLNSPAIVRKVSIEEPRVGKLALRASLADKGRNISNFLQAAIVLTSQVQQDTKKQKINSIWKPVASENHKKKHKKTFPLTNYTAPRPSCLSARHSVPELLTEQCISFQN